MFDGCPKLQKIEPTPEPSSCVCRLPSSCLLDCSGRRSNRLTKSVLYIQDEYVLWSSKVVVVVVVVAVVVPKKQEHTHT